VLHLLHRPLSRPFQQDLPERLVVFDAERLLESFPGIAREVRLRDRMEMAFVFDDIGTSALKDLR
jgi:hypothetical protein